MTKRKTAPSDVRWSSVLARSGCVPKQWGEWRSPRVLKLKDTKHRYWRNTLESPNTFRYAFPRNSKRVQERLFVERMLAAMGEDASPLRVHLFSTPGSTDEYLGEWIVEDVVPRDAEASVLVLKRDAEQDAALLDEYAAHARARRSANEARHERWLGELFPEEAWRVVHEPETLMDLHEPSVVDGVERELTQGATQSYTCDFVVSHRRGCQRFCVESKPCRSHVTPAALLKCRQLRDRTYARVVILAGAQDGEDEWYDLGPPGTEQESGWCATEGLKRSLGV